MFDNYATLLTQGPREVLATIHPGPQSVRGGIWSTNDIYVRLLQKTYRGGRKCKVSSVEYNIQVLINPR